MSRQKKSNLRESRVRRFEEFEKRLVMSAQAVTDIAPLVDADQFIQEQVEMTSIQDQSSELADVDQIREQYGFDGSGQTVAIIDSGIAWDHYALGDGFGDGSRVVGGWDFAENDADPYDDGPVGFHGTHVAGIVGANDSEFSGVASGVDLVGLRVFDDYGGGNLEWVEQALQWVHEHKDDFENPITTVNLSLGTTWNSSNTPDWATLEDEFAQLKEDGIFIAVAAGNSFEEYNERGLSYPASSPFVVPVASHDGNGNLSDFSQRDWNALVAPGEMINSTVPDHLFGVRGDGEFLKSTGTSMAAPYVAGASTLLRQANEFMGVENVTQDMLYQQFRDTADQIYDSVTGGYYHQLNLAEAINSVIEDWHADFENAATKIGNMFGGEQIEGIIGAIGDSDHFSFVASETGQVTLTIDTTHDLTALVDVLGIDATVDGNKVTFNVESGIEYGFSIGTSDGLGHYKVDFDFMENSDPVALVGGQLVFAGTEQADDVKVTVGDNLTIEINGRSYSFDAAEVEGINLIGGGGDDRLELNLESTREAVAIGDGWLTVATRGDKFDTIAAEGFETISVDSGGGNDSLVMRDTNSNDRFSNNGSTYQMIGGGQINTATGFNNVVASSSGGIDTAELNGTAGDDVFGMRDGVAMIRGGGISISANGFERVSVDGQGGQDLANVFDSAGDDRFVMNPNYLFADMGETRVWVSSFDRINAFSREGSDTVEMTDSLGDDVFYQNNSESMMSGVGFTSFARGFDNIQAVSIGGTDLAQLTDTAGNDVYYANAHETRLESGDLNVTTAGFDRVNMVGRNGGYDRAFVTGTSGVDIVYADSNSTTMTSSLDSIARVVGFDRVSLAGGGGADVALLRGSSGNDSLSVGANDVEFETTLQLLRMVQFESTSFDGNGGTDQVSLEGFDELDLLTGLGDKAVAYLNGNSITAQDFDLLEASVEEGHSSRNDLDAVDFLFDLDGDWHSF